MLIYFLTICDAFDIVDLLVKALAEFMVDTKENIDDNLLACFRNGNKVITDCIMVIYLVATY